MIEVARDIVDVRRVRQRHQLAIAQRHSVRLLVVSPVADIPATFGDEVIDGIPRLGRASAKPTCGAFSGRRLNAIQRRADFLAFLVNGDIDTPHAIRLVMPHELPVQLARSLDDLWMEVADLAIERRRSAYSMFRHHVEDAPNSDAVSVVANRPISHRRTPGLVVWKALVVRAGHVTVKTKELDIWRDPQGDSSSIRPDQTGPLGNWHVGERSIGALLHDLGFPSKVDRNAVDVCVGNHPHDVLAPLVQMRSNRVFERGTVLLADRSEYLPVFLQQLLQPWLVHLDGKRADLADSVMNRSEHLAQQPVLRRGRNSLVKLAVLPKESFVVASAEIHLGPGIHLDQLGDHVIVEIRNDLARRLELQCLANVE